MKQCSTSENSSMRLSTCVCVFVCAHMYMNTCDQGDEKILLQIINEIMIGTSFVPVVVKRKDRFYSCTCTTLTTANRHTEVFFFFFFLYPQNHKVGNEKGRRRKRELLEMIAS